MPLFPLSVEELAAEVAAMLSEVRTFVANHSIGSPRLQERESQKPRKLAGQRQSAPEKLLSDDQFPIMQVYSGLATRLQSVLGHGWQSRERNLLKCL